MGKRRRELGDAAGEVFVAVRGTLAVDGRAVVPATPTRLTDLSDRLTAHDRAAPGLAGYDELIGDTR